MSREFDPIAHERMVRNLHDEQTARIGRVATFEELMARVDEGELAFDDAISQLRTDTPGTDPQA